LGHTTINHKVAAIAADGGRCSNSGNSHCSSKDGGSGGSSNIGANSFDNDRGRWQQWGLEQTTISKKAADMVVVAAAMAIAVT
jgi:hypothetical protein